MNGEEDCFYTAEQLSVRFVLYDINTKVGEVFIFFKLSTLCTIKAFNPAQRNYVS